MRKIALLATIFYGFLVVGSEELEELYKNSFVFVDLNYGSSGSPTNDLGDNPIFTEEDHDYGTQALSNSNQINFGQTPYSGRPLRLCVQGSVLPIDWRDNQPGIYISYAVNELPTWHPLDLKAAELFPPQQQSFDSLVPKQQANNPSANDERKIQHGTAQFSNDGAQILQANEPKIMPLPLIKLAAKPDEQSSPKVTLSRKRLRNGSNEDNYYVDPLNSQCNDSDEGSISDERAESSNLEHHEKIGGVKPVELGEYDKDTPSKSPVFDAFVKAAFFKHGAEIIDEDTAKIRINIYDKFLETVKEWCSKRRQTGDQNSRIKAFKKFVSGWPSRGVEAKRGNFIVTVKNSNDELKSGTARFKLLVELYKESKSLDLYKRSKKLQKRSNQSE